jgi:hypothetical protein
VQSKKGEHFSKVVVIVLNSSYVSDRIKIKKCPEGLEIDQNEFQLIVTEENKLEPASEGGRHISDQ